MNRLRVAELLLWTGTLFGGVIAAARYGAESQRLRSLAVPTEPSWDLSVPTLMSADSLAVAADVIEQRNLFRADRSSEEEGPPPLTTVVSPAPLQPPKPQLVLRGVLGGPPWNAIVGGIPGQDNDVLLKEGDTVGGLRVRHVGPNGVQLRGLDTTWNLSLAR